MQHFSILQPIKALALSATMLTIANGLSAQSVQIYRAGTAIGSPLSSIKQAVDTALEMDSLVLSAGIFNEKNIHITKSLFISGQYSGGTVNSIIKPTSADSSIFIFYNTNYPHSTKTLHLKDIIIENGRANNTTRWGGGALLSLKGTITSFEGHCNLKNNLALTDSSFSDSASGNGGAVYSEGELIFKDQVNIDSSNRAEYGGAIFSTGKCTLLNHATINGQAIEGGAIYSQGTLIIQDSALLSGYALSTSDSNKGNGGAIFAQGAAIYLKGFAQIQHAAASNKGAGIYLLNSYFQADDSFKIIANHLINPGQEKGAAIYALGNNEITINGGQIINNNSLDTNSYAYPIYHDSSSGSSTVISINKARIYNPQSGFEHKKEFYNLQKTAAFLSDSCWWGQSIIDSVIYNDSSATVGIRSYIQCDWILNDGLPISGLSHFPIKNQFRLSSGTALPKNSFTMLNAYYQADSGSFSANPVAIDSNNLITNQYSAPSSSSWVKLNAWVDADSIEYKVYVIGLGIKGNASYQAATLYLYPNPSQGIINIQIQNLTIAHVKYQILDLSGKIVQKGLLPIQNNNARLHCTQPKGSYLLQLIVEDQILPTQKIELLE